MRSLLVLIGLVMLSGCTLLEQLGRRDAPADRDGPPPVMMMADSVPLVSDGTPHALGKPMPVPLEPSPFITGKNAKPAAMKSDNESRRRTADDSGVQPIPKEPVPSARPDS